MFSPSLLSIISIFLIAVDRVSPAPTPNILAHDDVILVGDGRIEKLKRHEWQALVEREGYLTEPPPPIHPSILTGRVINTPELAAAGLGTPPSDPNTTSVAAVVGPQKRCDKFIITQKIVPILFLGPDVLMSRIIHATGYANVVAVTDGYSIANTLSYAMSFAAEINYALSDILKIGGGASFTVSWGKTWTTSYQVGYTFGVPKNKYGAIVTNPWTHRQAGYIDYGCVGSSDRGHYQGDSYTNKGSGGLSWVDGIISVCTSDTFPLPFCIGNGTHDDM